MDFVCVAVGGTANIGLYADYFDWNAIDVHFVAHLLPNALDMAFGSRRVGVFAWDISKLPLIRKRLPNTHAYVVELGQTVLFQPSY